MKTRSKRYILILTIILAAAVFMPYAGSALAIPGRTHPNAGYFKGEWFNRYDLSVADYGVLDRWAHYYGYHSCEPEPDNCPYRGITGRWKLILSYLLEKKPFPAKMLKVKPTTPFASDPSGKGEPPSPKEIQGLVRVKDVDNSILIELKYATKDNFTGKVIYPSGVAVLQKGTAEKLAKASKELVQYNYRIKIWDAYRPLDAQQVLWDATPNKYYVANPKNGSKHNRGAAVDVTLVDLQGNEVEMPTGFDDFSQKAHRSYSGMSKEAARNLGILTDIMARCGFNIIHREWWHYEDKDWEKYPLLNVKLEEFSE